jgi:hypothetical protein
MMWAEALIFQDAATRMKAAALRKRFPRFAQAIGDFHLKRAHPDAFVWREMPKGWQRAQRILAIERAHIDAYLQERQVQKLDLAAQVLQAIGR